MKANDIAGAKELNIVVHCLGAFHLFINLWAAWEVLWVVWAWKTSSALLWLWHCSIYNDWKGICKSASWSPSSWWSCISYGR